MMARWLVSLVLLGLVWLRVVSGAPAESVKGKDEFVFVLPGVESGSKLNSGLPFSVELQPPFETTFIAAKDSYGNPVPAFNTAADSPIENRNKVVDAGGLKFEIPSYASGITEIRQPTDELLPPLTSEEQQADSFFTPEFNIPSVELLPPLSSDNIFQNNPKDVSINEISKSFDAKTTVEPDTETGKTDPQESGGEVTTTVKYDGEKYTGGFGGAPGILGEQKNVGYAVKVKDADVEAEVDVEQLETTTANFETSTHTEEPDTTAVGPTTISTEITPLETRAPPTSAENTTAPPTNSYADEMHQSESSSTPTSSQDSDTDDTHQSESSSIPISSTESYGDDEHHVKSSSTLLPTTTSQFTFDIIPEAPANDLVPPFLPTGLFAPLEEQPPTAFSQRFGFDKSSPTQRIPETDQKPIVQPDAFVFVPPGPKAQTIEPPNRILLTPFETSIIAPAEEIPSNTVLSSPNSPSQLPSNTSIFPVPESQAQPIEPPSTSILTQSQNPYLTPPSISIFTPPLPFPASPSASLLTSPYTQAAHSSTLTPLAISPFPQKNLGGSFSFQGSSSISAQSSGSGAGKYSGGFGGAPGILGNQQKPGYAVQADGTIKDPDQKYQPPVNQVTPIAVTRPPLVPFAPVSAVQAPVKAPSSVQDKYTGGFGGPPGLLSPFDDQKRG